MPGLGHGPRPAKRSLYPIDISIFLTRQGYFSQIFPNASDMLGDMKQKTRKNLKAALSVTIAIAVTGLIFFAVAKFAPQDPFVSSGFVQDVGSANRQ
jgi:hypothetical protein